MDLRGRRRFRFLGFDVLAVVQRAEGSGVVLELRQLQVDAERAAPRPERDADLGRRYRLKSNEQGRIKKKEIK